MAEGHFQAPSFAMLSDSGKLVVEMKRRQPSLLLVWNSGNSVLVLLR